MQLSVLSSASLPRSRGDSPLYLLDDRPALENEYQAKKKNALFMCCSAPSTNDVDSDHAWVKLRLIEVHTSERLMVQISIDGSNRSNYNSLQIKFPQEGE